MKRSITSILTLVLALVLVAALPLTASAADYDYEKTLDFMPETSNYEASLVYNNLMKTAGDSRKMGYKGWLGSANVEGATSVFVFEAAEGETFASLTINFRGYSIAEGAPDGVHIYVSTVGETDYSAGYTEGNWDPVAKIVNDATAGDGINVADPTNRDPELLRSVDVTDSVLGCNKVYMRIDFYRSSNIDNVPATYFAPVGATGTYLSAAPVVTEPETTAAPETTEAPAPETTEQPSSPDTGDNTSVILAIALVAVVAVAGTAACVIRKESFEN